MKRAFRATSMMLVALSLTGCGPLRWTGGDSDALVASGTLEAEETVIAPRVNGEILELPFAAGATVTKGDVLVRLDDRAVQLQLRQAPDSASRETALLQSQDYTLRSPLSGVVTRVPAHAGELALPGQVLIAVSDLSTLRLTLYVRLADLGRVATGQRLAITADPYPGRTFEGVVTSINQQAEFTPRNVQTPSDRLNRVFGVQAPVTNGEGLLRPGMPIDATFGTGAAP